VSGIGTRGIVEGFYGRPWTADQRLDMVDFIAEIGMNTYVYSPKDDPFTRRRWREPYDRAAADELRVLTARARSAGIAFSYGLSPGLSMRYAEPQDAAAVFAKLDSVHDLGVTEVALFLDDIPGHLQHPGDVEVFADLVTAQLSLIVSLELRLEDAGNASTLTVCPTQYWGRGDEPYIAALGSGLAPRTQLFWTGRAICSPELDADDADVFARAAGRRPLYWDNFPVNDVAMTGELHIGPYLGRDPRLQHAAAGIIANPMPLAEASKIALFSVADFCRAPHDFDPEQSWEAALARVAGPGDADDLRDFADAFRGSALCTDDAPRLGEALDRFAFRYEFDDRTAAVTELQGELRRLAGVSKRMERLDNQALTLEIAPWAAQYARGIEALGAAIESLDLVGSGGPPELTGPAREAVASRLRGLRSTGLRAFGDRVDMFLSDIVGEFNSR
jgi:hyaluronoglucosaminidase